MKKKYRIKKNEEFQQVFQKGHSMANRQFVIYVLDRPEQPYFRIGLSVSKKIGKAVVRNRVKRYIRQTFLELRDQVATAKDYVIIARRPVSEMNYAEVKKKLNACAEKSWSIRESFFLIRMMVKYIYRNRILDMLGGKCSEKANLVNDRTCCIYSSISGVFTSKSADHIGE